MRGRVWKLFLAVFALVVALLASPSAAQTYECPDEGMYVCFCDTGGWTCTYSASECEWFCREVG